MISQFLVKAFKKTHFYLQAKLDKLRALSPLSASTLTRPTHINIDLKAVKDNLISARKCARTSKVLSCVKADAYGHGIVPVAQAISDDVDAFGVACLEEAVCLRDAGVTKPILLLEGAFCTSEISQIAALELWTVVHSFYQIEFLRAQKQLSQIQVWLKMDSGMHRLGFSPAEYSVAYEMLLATPCVSNLVHMTHFASADELDNQLTSEQLQCFSRVTDKMSGSRSTSNSAAIMAWEQAHMDWIRPGFMLYGASPFSVAHPVADALTPAMELMSRVVATRDIDAGEGVGYNQHWIAERASRIAVVAIGYGDGYPRNTGDGTPVLVSGKRAKIVGRVAMDMLLVDITGLEGIEVGAEVELWGKNLSITEVAAQSGYSPYELMTRLTSRLSRNYLNSV